MHRIIKSDIPEDMSAWTAARFTRKGRDGQGASETMYVHGPWGMAEDDDGSWSAYAIVDRSPMRIRKGLASFKEGAVFIRDSRDGNRMEGDCMEKGTGGTEDVEGVKEHHYTDDKGLQSITEVGGVERIDKAVTGDRKDDPRIKAKKEGNPGHFKVPIAPGSKDVVEAYVHNMGDNNPADYEVDITEVMDRPEETPEETVARREKQRAFNEKVKAKNLEDAQKLAEQEANAPPSMTPAQMEESDRAKTRASRAYGGNIDGNHMIYDFQTGEAQGEALTAEDIGYESPEVSPETLAVRDAVRAEWREKEQAKQAKQDKLRAKRNAERKALNDASNRAVLDTHSQIEADAAKAARKKEKEAARRQRRMEHQAMKDRELASTDAPGERMGDALRSVRDHAQGVQSKRIESERFKEDPPETLTQRDPFDNMARRFLESGQEPTTDEERAFYNRGLELQAQDKASKGSGNPNFDGTTGYKTAVEGKEFTNTMRGMEPTKQKNTQTGEPENIGKSQHFMKSARELYAEKMGLKMTGAKPLNPATADMPSLRDGSVHQAGFRTTVIGYGHDNISRDPRNAQVSSSGMRVRRL